ncbi:MAG: hypothetical protein QX189_10810, partial [Methylococcales bacterium]
ERLDIFSKIVSSSFMEIFFQGGVFEDSIFPEFKISSLLFQKTVRTIDNDTGKYGFEKIISINPKNDSAVVIDNDGQLKTFSAADNGDRWHYMAHVMPSQNKACATASDKPLGKAALLICYLSPYHVVMVTRLLLILVK